MKSKFFLALVGIAAMFTSCNNDLVPETDGTTKQVTFQVAADQGLNTRADATGVNNFLIEVYTDAEYTTEASDVFGNTNKATSTDGSFLMTLDKTKAYYCLLWADRDASVYTTSNLKEVTLVDGKTPVEAWQGKYTIAAGATEPTASLQRAVAKITLLETGKLKAGTLTMAFKQKTVFNVSTGATTTTESDRSEPISVAAIDVANAAGTQIDGNDIFVLASTTDAYQPTITFKMGDAEEISVSNVPLKANYNTNIKGHFIKENGVTLKVTCDDTWGDPEYNEEIKEPVAKLEVGGWYPAGATKANAVGVIFKITDGGEHGTIVSMDEIEGNFTAVGTWVGDKNDGGLQWFLPSDSQLCELYDVWNGSSNTTANTEARTAFNSKLTTLISAESYWTSLDVMVGVCLMNFDNRSISSFENNKSNTHKARAFADF